MNEINLTLNLYKEDGVYGIYIGDNIGGSGIGIKNKNEAIAALEACNYIIDYLKRLGNETNN